MSHGKNFIWQFREKDISRLLLFAVLVLAVLNASVFYAGFGSGDDRQYVISGYKMAVGEPLAVHLGHLRLGMTVPCMVVLKLTGHSIFAVTLFFSIFFFLLLFGTYIFGRICGLDRFTSLFAAFLTATCPLLVRNSSVIMPDLPLACYSLYCVIFAVKASRAPVSDVKGLSIKLACAALSGVLLSLAYLTKMSAVIVLPVLLSFFLLGLREREKSWLWAVFCPLVLIVSVLGVTVIVEMFILEHLTGVRELRFLLAHSTFTDNPRIVDRLATVPVEPIARLQLLLGRLSVLGPIKWIMIAAVAFYPFLRRRSWYIYLPFAWFFLYLTFGSTNLTSYIPNTIPARYYMITLPFGFLITAHVLKNLISVLWARSGSRRARVALISVAVGITVLISLRSYSLMAKPYFENKYAEIQATSKAIMQLRQSSDRPIVLSAFLAIRLSPFFFGGHDSRLVLTDRQSRIDDIIEALEHPEGCYYLEAARETDKFSHYQYDNEIDKMVDAHISNSDSRDRRFEVQQLIAIPSYYSRLEAIRAEWLPMIFKGDVPDPNQPLKIFIRKIIPALDHTPGVRETTDLIPEWRSGGLGQLRERWSIASKFGRKFELVEGEQNYPQLILRMKRFEYLWLRPILKNISDTRFITREAHTGVVMVDTTITGNARAELILRMFGGPEQQESLGEKRISLGNGRRSLKIADGSRKIFFVPNFKIFGEGIFTIKRFQAKYTAVQSGQLN